MKTFTWAIDISIKIQEYKFITHNPLRIAKIMSNFEFM